MKNIAFLGNIAFDKLILPNDVKVVPGGAVVYGSVAANMTKENRISIVGTAGNDFPLSDLEKLGIQTNYVSIASSPSNTFIINESKNTIFLEAEKYLPITIPPLDGFDHVHISCRKGVPFQEAIQSCLKHTTLSLDVMWSSIKDLLPDFKAVYKKADFIFCNAIEYEMMKNAGLDIVNEHPSAIVFITSDNQVLAYYNHQKTTFPVKKVDMPVSTVGAGDTFCGYFLSQFLSGENFHDATTSAINIASRSVLDIGTMHLKQTKPQKLIWRGKNATDAICHICYRDILQR